ncbi:hypothetical protein AX769_13070 [Frondihabitans sp. PAMC 28766]|uniref:type II 3-dehydroquinate dehydratase n=1 Tax=Frondihabitans sp. PAMC 28766 TaxID=1795630 RepID=UPI00078B73EE|nr:type II 3-dehydroquinate dehydratase [Frondihabitans sp. PAMC 28766]AMM20902.1 hypothetical protein AX769_13070 [Frondihabitans sp. PAMC 28766]
MTTVLVVVGPDIGRRGLRLPGGAAAGQGSGANESVAELRRGLEGLDGLVDVAVDFRQTDDEAELITWLHQAADDGWGVVLDPGGFTHYSYALRDAAALVVDTGLPLIEVHLANPASRDDFRAAGVISAVSTGIIAGLGVDSYRLAVRAAAERVQLRAAAAAPAAPSAG